MPRSSQAELWLGSNTINYSLALSIFPVVCPSSELPLLRVKEQLILFGSPMAGSATAPSASSNRDTVTVKDTPFGATFG